MMRKRLNERTSDEAAMNEERGRSRWIESVTGEEKKYRKSITLRSIFPYIYLDTASAADLIES